MAEVVARYTDQMRRKKLAAAYRDQTDRQQGLEKQADSRHTPSMVAVPTTKRPEPLRQTSERLGWEKKQGWKPEASYLVSLLPHWNKRQE